MTLGDYFRGAYFPGYDIKNSVMKDYDVYSRIAYIEISIQQLAFNESCNRFPLTKNASNSNDYNLSTTLYSSKTKTNNTSIDWKSMKYIIKVGAGTTGFDLFYIRILKDDGTPCFILIQCRHSKNNNSLNYEEIEKSYYETLQQFSKAENLISDDNEKSLFFSAMKIFVVITNRPYVSDEVPDGCILICNQNLEYYFGSLTPRILLE